jgi:signal transduction histidine kinase
MFFPPPKVSMVVDTPSNPSADPVQALDTMLRALSRTLHDVNNPLTVISGNAQLLNEIGPSMGLSPELQKPIGDIEEASVMLAEQLAELAALRERLQEGLNTVRS